MRNEIKIGRNVPRKKMAARFGVISTLAALALLAVPYRASAIDIQMTFKTASSISPSNDSDGALLTAMMASVEAYYEDIFECSGTLQVEFYYANLDSSTLSIHNCLARSGGKPTKCRIQIDNDRLWYYDQTPTDSSEYEMTRTLARDLTSSDKTSFFTGTPNDLLEVSNKGTALSTAPTECISGYDLYTVLLHEMGHGMGLSNLIALSEETSDLDYDYDPALVWGETLAANSYASNNLYHLKATTAMYPTIGTGKRVMPTATDIFAMETTATWGNTTIDLPRKDFYSTDPNADFSSPANWSGNHLPDAADDIWVRDGGESTLSASVTMHDLMVSETANTINTGAYTLHATGNATLGDGTNEVCVSVQNGGEFQVDDTLTVTDNAEILLAPGSTLNVDTLDMNGGELTIEDDGVSSATIDIATADLDGILTLNLIDGYTPAVGHSFTVMTYDARSGEFTSILCNNPDILLSADYSPTALTLLVTAVPEPSTLVMLTTMLLAFGYLKRKR